MAESLDARDFVRISIQYLLTIHDLKSNSQNAGQNCIGIERLIVHSSQHDELLEELRARVEMLRLGSVLYSADGYISPVDCGSMISSTRFSDLRELITEAVHEGASLVYGGEQFKHAYLNNGSYFTPTVIGDIVPSMSIARTECE